MGHSHIVLDTDTHFTIDPLTRAIINQSDKNAVMQYDHNSERLTFSMPRHIEGHDMSVCNKVEAHFMNIDSKTKDVISGHRELDDFRIDPADDEKVRVSWLITKGSTKLGGKLNFLLNFRCVEDDVETYSWHTDFYLGFMVNAGMDAAALFEVEYSDVIAQWKESVMAHFTADMDAWKESTKGVLSREIDQKIAVERARIDQFTALKDGSTTGDAELIDGRISEEGYVYTTIGNHIRAVHNHSLELIDCLEIDGYESQDLFKDVKNEMEKVVGYFFRCPDSNMSKADSWNCYTLPVRTGEKYHIRTYTVSAGAAVAFMAMGYDSAEIDPPVAYYPQTSSAGEIYDIVVTVPQNAVQMLVNEQTEKCIATIEKYSSKHFTQIFDDSDKSVLYGKTLVCCGDSITEAVNPNGGYFTNYAEIVANRHNMICHKDGVGGSTMAIGNGKSFSINRYLNVPEFDYLTIWFGWNDAAYSALGTIKDEDNSTFYGAYKIVLDHLVAKHPTKKIGVVVPYGSEEVEPFAQAVREISNMFGVPCLDLKNHNICSLVWGTANKAQLARRNALTYDGTHPNQAGHDFLATMYESFLLGL